jgi:hypothetical protein
MTSDPGKASASQPSTCRVGVVTPINFPLSFYAVTLLIVEATLGFVLTESDIDVRHKFYGLLLAAGAFIVVVVLVTLLVWFRPSLLRDR